MLWRSLAVAAGGGVGSLLRYLVSGWVQRVRWPSAWGGFGASFPWGTLAVNLTGCLTIGLVAGLFQRRAPLHPAAASFLLIGLLGGYTTFSTFSLETLRLLDEGSFGLALANGLGSPLLGVLGAWLGDLVARGMGV